VVEEDVVVVASSPLLWRKDARWHVVVEQGYAATTTNMKIHDVHFSS
jgi:hypothetical protein